VPAPVSTSEALSTEEGVQMMIGLRPVDEPVPATMAHDAEFAALAAPHRRELLAHCYRMLGSVHEAEDLVQETYLRAWRSFDRFEGRSSLRAWLYKIATMACLTALEGRARRPLPSGLGGPGDEHERPLVEAGAGWLEPAPDTLFAAPDDPAAVVGRRAGVRLAFIAALQLLSPRQRAVLILSDVLAWPAKDVAELLGSSATAVYSILRRARAALERSAVGEEQLSEPGGRAEQDLLDRYTDAFERADLTALVGLLRLDVELEMPPNATWFSGRDAVAGFLGARVLRDPGHFRMVATRANGDPAVVVLGRAADGSYHPHGVHVLSVVGGRIARIVAFLDPAVVAAFGYGDR
jgi:RNA polymerase sigma-70 factor (TIGR02960 family)